MSNDKMTRLREFMFETWTELGRDKRYLPRLQKMVEAEFRVKLQIENYRVRIWHTRLGKRCGYAGLIHLPIKQEQTK